MNTIKNEFGTCEKILKVIQPMQDIERLRASDRAKVDALMNGRPPYTAAEAEKNQIPVNVNWGMGKKILRDANNQVNSALLHPGILFTCTLEAGQQDKRDEWSQAFTKNIHIPLQRGVSGKRHAYLIKSRNASICLHGIGAMLWPNSFRWMPRFVGLEDLLIPTETYCDFSNMRYFAVNMYLTPGELMDMTKGDTVKGWNKPMIAEILKNMVQTEAEGVPSTWRDQPEAMQNVMKENRGFYYSDATRKIRCHWFFYQQIDNPKKWYRMLVLRESYGDVKPDQGFLFDGSAEPFADDIGQILSIQYGDNNFVPPLKYHAVRGLGVDLYAPIEELNRLFCEFIWAVHIDFRILFKIKDPQDRDKLKQITLSQFGTIPEGMEMLKKEERYQVSPELFNEAVGVMRSTLQESSTSFVKDINESNREMTAKEATIRSNEANILVSSMLQSLYFQEGFYYEEVVRRFLKKDSADTEVKEFQARCKKDGIPEDLMRPSIWRVVPERVLGGGDKTKAQEEATWIWSVMDRLDPAVQNKAKRMCVGTLLNDFDKARELVPEANVAASDGVIAAENVFGTLMAGQDVKPRKGIDQQGYISTLLNYMNNVVMRISQTSGVGTESEIIGLQTVAQNVQQHIEVLGTDVTMKPLVKVYADSLGKIMNEVKAFAQRLQEQQQAQQEKEQVIIEYKDAPYDVQRQMEQKAGFQPSQMPPTPDDNILKAQFAQQAAQLKERQAAQQSQQDEAEFAMEQQRQNAATQAEMARKAAEHQQDMELTVAKAEVEREVMRKKAAAMPKKKVDSGS